MSVDIVAQIFGMAMVGIITVCIIVMVLGLIFDEMNFEKRNKKLLENMKKFDKNKNYDK